MGLAIALKNDSRLLSAEQDRIIAEERVTEAKLVVPARVRPAGLGHQVRRPLSLRPVAGSGGHTSPSPAVLPSIPPGPRTSTPGRGYMNFPIYEGGRSINTLRLAQAALQQAQSNYEAVKMEVVLAAKEAFYPSAHGAGEACRDHRGRQRSPADGCRP